MQNESYTFLQEEAKKWAALAVEDMPPNPLQPREMKQQALEKGFLAEIDQIIAHISHGFKVFYDGGCMADWTPEQVQAFKDHLELMRTKKPEELKSNFQQELGLSDNELIKWYVYALDLYEKRSLQDAVDAFFVLTSLNPGVASFWMGLAQAQELSQQLEEAAESYLMAAAAKNEDLRPALFSAECYRELGQTDKAKALLDEVSAQLDQQEGQEILKEDILALKNQLSK